MNAAIIKTEILKAQGRFRRSGFSRVNIDPKNVMPYGRAPRSAAERRKFGEELAAGLRLDVTMLGIWHHEHSAAKRSSSKGFQLPSKWWRPSIDGVLTVPAMLASLQFVPDMRRAMDYEGLPYDEEDGNVGVRWAVMRAGGSGAELVRRRMFFHDYAWRNRSSGHWESHCFAFLSAPSLRDLVVMCAASGQADRSRQFANWTPERK